MFANVPPWSHFIPALICLGVLLLTAICTAVWWMIGWLSRGD